MLLNLYQVIKVIKQVYCDDWCTLILLLKGKVKWNNNIINGNTQMVEHWRENTMITLLKEWHPDWLTVCTFKTNRPFYSCGLGVIRVQRKSVLQPTSYICHCIDCSGTEIFMSKIKCDKVNKVVVVVISVSRVGIQ